MNIFYIGSSGALSLIPFKRLLAGGFNIVAVGIYNPVRLDSKIIALENESLALAANQANIPVVDLSRPVTGIVKHCAGLSIDVTLMSCYAKRLPDEVIQLAGKGCYNMHPSLLPAYRGPEPVFWQMKYASDIGVSWHQVDSDFDAGDIVAQKKVFPDDGLTHAEISMQLAENGSMLMLEMLSDISTGCLHKVRQDSEHSSYYPYPDRSDFVIDTAYDAQQVYNFMCATQAFGYAYRYQCGRHLLYLTSAVDYDNNRTLDTVEVHADKLYIPCNGGVLIATYTDKIPA